MISLKAKYNNGMLNVDSIRMLYCNGKHTIKEISDKLDIPFWTLYGFMDKHNIARRNNREANFIFNRFKPQFKTKSGLSFREDKLKVAGIMLYWAEGTLRGKTVDFANSNPYMVRIFLQFLRKICGINEARLRVYLYAYSYHNLEELKCYWQDVTGISLAQFTKPYIRTGNLNLSKRKLPHGLVHIRYNDAKLLAQIDLWIKEYIDNINIWVGTQVAKGGRLCKRSVLPKGEMEK